MAVLDYMGKVDVLTNVRARGLQHDLADRFPFVVDIHGRGLLWGFEFVADIENETQPPVEDNAAGAFVDRCFDRGLIVYPAGIAPLNDAVLLSPPLTILASALQDMEQRGFMRAATAQAL